MIYLWFKTLHIVSMVAWFAGLFYIWRLFVYHSETDSAEVRATLAIMEEKLSRIIMRPAMAATYIFGIGLLYMQWDFFSHQYWIWLKIGFVICVSGITEFSQVYRKKLAKGEEIPSKTFRILNEIPTILLIVIVYLVVFKPV